MSQLRTALKVLLIMTALIVGNLSTALAEGSEKDPGASSGGSGSWYQQKAERRETTRWTLAEWLAQKDRNRMMDLWLSMHSSSPFEFMLGGGYLSTTTTVDSPASSAQYTSYDGEFSAYAELVGLTAEYHNNTPENTNDFSGMLDLRLFGDSLQNSSITLHAGQRTRTFVAAGTSTGQRNTFQQVSLQMYLAKHFGLDGFYRSYNSAKNDVSGDTIGGTESQAGLFIDFKAVRVFGAWNRDIQTNVNTNVNSTTTRESLISGLKFYF